MKYMIQQPEISVIVPVYNSEKFLNKCLDSILKQTYRNFELILINDGSTDNSLNIIKEYAKKDKRITIINQKNQGPGLTRNNGIKKSKGKYIMFIDSDDYIDKDYIKTHYASIYNTNKDIIISGFRKVNLNGKIISFERCLKSGEFAKYIVMGPVAKIYRKELIEKNKVRFTDTRASEDIQFNLSLFNLGANVDTISYIGYNYVYNECSISNTIHKDFDEKINIIDFLNSINYKTISNVELNQYYIIRHCITYLLYGGKKASSKSFIKEYKKIFNWIENNIENYKKNKYLRKMPDGEIKKVYFVIRIFLLIHKFNLMGLFSKVYCKH